MFNIHAQRNTMLMIIVVLCTLTIIWTNYMFTKNVVLDINSSIMENEYKKIWWKENYIILQAIQKKEVLSYLNSIKNDQPWLIKEILERQTKKEKSNNNILEKNTIDDLKKDTYVKWNTWAIISVIEFSDMECSFCKIQHTSWIFKDILDKNTLKVNYIFKNFPLPWHKNAGKEAEASKCVENISWWEKYLEYIDEIFKNTKSGWEWYKLKDLSPLAVELKVDKSKFEKCFSSWVTTSQVEKEFIQWRMLWINSVPSILIINNDTWEYKIISEVMDFTTLESNINELLK